MPRIRQELLRATAIGSAVFGTMWQSAVAQPAVPYSWSGYYVGGFVGGATNNSPLRFNTPDSSDFNTVFLANTPRYFNTPFAGISNRFDFTPFPQSFKTSGNFVSGFNVGYNVQKNGWLYGVEADFSLLGRVGRKDWSDVNPFDVVDAGKSAYTASRTTNLSASGGVDALATFRGRAGFVMDRWLVFGTAGLAVGHGTLRTSASVVDHYTSSIFGFSTAYDVSNSWTGSNSQFRVGYAVGGGVEYALTDRFRLKFDSLYYNLGTLRAVAHGTGFYTQDGGAPTQLSVQPYTVSKRLDGALFRVGFNYGF